MKNCKVTFILKPSHKINMQAVLRKLKKDGSHIKTQDELAQAIFKRKDLIDLISS